METNPDIFSEFKSNDSFTVKTTKNKFSALGLDQLYE